MKRAGNLPYEIIVLKYVNERDPGDIKTIQLRVETHVIRRELASGEQCGQYSPGIRVQDDHFRRIPPVNRANEQAMLSFVKRHVDILPPFAFNGPSSDYSSLP